MRALSLALATAAAAIPAAMPAGAAATPSAAAAVSHHRSPRSSQPAVRMIPVSFTVTNVNATPVSCAPATADGRTYTVSGTLILPRGATPFGVALYAHGLGYSRSFWAFTAVPGYDYAGAEATAGHASVVIDRLGYGASSIPAGTATCVGSQATILHEIVQQLRSGRYTATALPAAPRFARVGLVGHSAGGELAEIEAYSFRDIDALGVMDWADQFYSTGAYSAFGSDTMQCARGDVTQKGSTEPGYATFGVTDAEYDQLMFADAAPAVVSAANRLRTNDPCGQIESILNGAMVDLAQAGQITVPVAYVHGGADAIFQAPLPWAAAQQRLYSGSRAVTDIGLPGEGHAVTLERGAPALEAAMSGWLRANGL